MKKGIKFILIVPYVLIFGIYNILYMAFKGWQFAWEELNEKLKEYEKRQ